MSGPTPSRLVLAGALVVGLVAGGVSGFLATRSSAPVGQPGPANASGLGGLPSCANDNVSPPCIAGTRSESPGEHRAIVTPTGNVTLESERGWATFPTEQHDWETLWWNVTVESFNGTLAVEITHPDNTTTWFSTPRDGFGWHNFSDPAGGRWTIEYHPEQSLRRIRSHTATYTGSIVYDFACGNEPGDQSDDC